MSIIRPVILCGGSGERLWPLSRKCHPKQFLEIVGEGSLFQQAVKRYGGKNPAIIITGEDYRFLVRQQLYEANIGDAEVVTEPFGKDTGPAILAAALLIASREPNSIMLIMPSDHYIPDTVAFSEMVEQGANHLDKGQIICFGVRPDRPETGYGYIRIGHPAGSVKPVLAFTEKPQLEAAKAFVKNGDYLWNAGIFMMRAGELIDIATELQPKMIEVARRAIANAALDLDFLRLDPVTWADMPAESFDYAFMEKVQTIGCIAFNGNWSDLGDWQAVGRLHDTDQHNNILHGPAHQIGSKNTLLWAEKEDQVLIGFGLKNITAIAMGDAVLIADQANSQELKTIVSELRSRGFSQATAREREYRPWGWFETIKTGKNFNCKILHVYADGQLSLQSHRYRSEHWVVVEGVATVVRGSEEFILKANESIYINAGDRHQLRNDSLEELKVVEVQTGSYFGEDDIERYEDKYRRVLTTTKNNVG